MLWGAIEMPFLRGGAAAQADLGVYQMARYIGLPIALAALFLMALWGWLIARTLGWVIAVRRHFAFVGLAFVNMAIPLGIYTWITQIWNR